MSFKIPGKFPYRAMSEDWRRWSKTLASALLVGLPLGLSAQANDTSEDLASRDSSAWNAEQSLDTPNWSATLELKARATIKSLATNIAALPSLIAGQAPASHHPLYVAQHHAEYDWSASWQHEQYLASKQDGGFWVELDCADWVDEREAQPGVEYSVSCDDGERTKSEPDTLPFGLCAIMPLQAISLPLHPAKPSLNARLVFSHGRVIDPSIYADQTLS